MSDEWGPWIEHDGSGCPVEGQLVDLLFRDGGGAVDGVVVAYTRVPLTWRGNPRLDPWMWGDELCFADIIRYRVRKPRGMAILNAILADLPTKVDA